ncbi:hypothetical protein CPB86DRAFT_712047, partial [Serendipita vermifera]
MKALSVGKPSIYKGEADYDRLEAWLEEVENWRYMHGLTEFATMTVMMVLVSDKAREWYKKCVRSEEAKWTLEEVGASILEELFPSNITEILREKFDHAKQGTHSLKEWHRYLTKLAKRVAHVSDAEIRRRFWYGSADYLRVKWAEAGMGPESAETTLEAMLKLGKVHEKIH